MMNVNTMLTNWTVLTSFFNDLWSLTYRKKTEKKARRAKTDAKKTGPPEDRKGQDRDRPKTENCRTETSLVYSEISVIPRNSVFFGLHTSIDSNSTISNNT